jgi:integrase/recombinase XerD
MEMYFKDAKTLSRLREGPFGRYLDLVAKQLSDDGYRKDSACQHIRLAADFGGWLQSEQIALETVTTKIAEDFLAVRFKKRRKLPGDLTAMARLLSVFRQEQIIDKETVPFAEGNEKIVLSFDSYLEHERTLAISTRSCYCQYARLFLNSAFQDDVANLSVLTAGDILSFFLVRAASLTVMETKRMATALRSFLKYALYEGYLQTDLVGAVPAVAAWSKSELPKSLPPHQVALVLSTCDRKTKNGRRDYAILLLLARLGLRAGEVVSLMLDDIDWHRGSIMVRGKGGHEAHLPIPVDVGEAIAAYLKDGRPKLDTRSLFINLKAPLTGLKGHYVIGDLVDRALKRAAIISPRRGAHQFRHSLATEMLRKGASMQEIGQILRHRSTQTTEIYAKVDVAALRDLAIAWPGGVQ